MTTDVFEIDIARANNLISQWGTIAKSIARQCKWRERGQCLVGCDGIAVCDLEGLALVNHQGQVIGSGFQVPDSRPGPRQEA